MASLKDLQAKLLKSEVKLSETKKLKIRSCMRSLRYIAEWMVLGCLVQQTIISLLFKIKIRKAFNSTSINHGVAVDFALSNERVKHPAMLVLRVPAGKGVGMYVREFGGEYGSEEYEFLMKRGTKYIITKVIRDGILPVIEAVVVK